MGLENQKESSNESKLNQNLIIPETQKTEISSVELRELQKAKAELVEAETRLEKAEFKVELAAKKAKVILLKIEKEAKFKSGLIVKSEWLKGLYFTM